MFRLSFIPCVTAFAFVLYSTSPALADPLLYAYEGDVLPYDQSAGWVVAQDCKPYCIESVSDGRFILSWGILSDIARYNLIVAQLPVLPPNTLWVEWSFRSNHPIGQFFDYCDGSLSVQYREIFDYLYMFGNHVQTSGGNGSVTDLTLDDFHTYRFDSLDGENYSFSVDGLIFLRDFDMGGSGYNAIQFGGEGRCPGDAIQEVINEWDFIRYGTIDFGEQIVSSNPPAGFVDAHLHPTIDRFTVTYDSPNYVCINEITVEIVPNQYRDREGAGMESDQAARLCDSIDNRQSQIDNPVVVATRRLDNLANPNPERQRRADHPALALGVPIVTATRRPNNGPPDSVEIVLDRPIPHNATTRFTFNDGTLSQSLEFTYAPGDTDGDGQATLFDLAAFQNCFGPGPLTGVCPVLDVNDDDQIDLSDLALVPI